MAIEVRQHAGPEALVLGLVRLRLGEESIHRGQCLGVLVVAVLDHRQVVHGVEVAVVVQPVGGERLGVRLHAHLDALETSGASARVQRLYQLICDPKWDVLFDREDANGAMDWFNPDVVDIVRVGDRKDVY